MSLLFGRRAIVRVGDVEIDSEGTLGLRISFNVKKNPANKQHPNTAQVVVYNLAEKTRRNLDGIMNSNLVGPPTRLDLAKRTIELSAGYGVENRAMLRATGGIGQIYAGEIALLHSPKGRVDWATTILCLTGRSAWQTFINKTLPEGTTNQQLVETVIDSIAKNDPITNLAAAKDAAKKGDYGGALDKITKSVTLIGSSMGNLQQLTAKLGMDAYVDDNELVLVKANQGLARRAIVLGPGTGLLDSPEPVHDDKAPNDTIFKAKSLLNANLQIGSKVVFDSESLKGEFVIRNLEHKGDTHQKEWTTEFEAVLFGSRQPNRSSITSRPLTQ